MTESQKKAFRDGLAAGMKDPSLFGFEVSAECGLSDWLRGEPPQVGWWNARVSFQGIPSPGTPSRRWWNGQHWSWPVLIGGEDEAYARSIMGETSATSPESIEYQGLLRPWNSLGA